MAMNKERIDIQNTVTYYPAVGDDRKQGILIFDGMQERYYHLKGNYLIDIPVGVSPDYRKNIEQITSKINKHRNTSKMLTEHGSNRLQIVDAVIQLSYNCNLACTYCYAEQGSYGSNKNLMDEATAKKAVDFVIANRYGDKVGFCLLGGEPLINKPVMESLIDYALEKGEQQGVEVEFLLTTNGIGLTQNLLNWLKKRNVSIRLSIDGTKEIHDHFRKNHSGEGTYDLVAKKYGERLKSSGIKYQVRCTYFGSFANDMVAQVENLAEKEGYTNVKIDFIWGDKTLPGAINANNLPEIIKNIDILSHWLRNKIAAGVIGLNSVHPFSKWINRIERQRNIANILPQGLRLSNFHGSGLEENGVECGAAVNVISISTKGEIYSCHRMEGKPEHQIGNIFQGVNLLKTQYWHDNWRLTHAASDCSRCWARYICAGGCPAFGIDEYQDPMRNDRDKCAIRRQFIANSLLIAAAHHKIDVFDMAPSD
mgnify:CR=1 FL=1